MNDFILPAEIEAMARQSATDIADAWLMLERMCVIKKFPFEDAKRRVELRLLFINELEAIRSIYHEIADL